MKYFQFLVIFIIPNILAQYAEDEQKINLDDIEDDNLLSERLAHENDPLITQSTQHLRPPSILAVNPYLTHQSAGGVIYATPATEGEIHYAQPVHDQQKLLHHHPHQVQYFTPHQSPEFLAEQNYNQQVYGTPAAVHEHDPAYTYTALASRQSLLKPIIPTIATYLQSHQHPEPQQFVYLTPQGRSLQHRQPQAIQQVVGGIQYVTQQPSSPIIYTHEDQEIGNEQKITPDDQIIYHHHHPKPQQIPGSGATYLQYVPYISRGSNNGQQYIIMAPIPAGYGQPTPVTKPILSYTHSPSPQQQLVQYAHQASNPVAGGIQYVTSNEIENVHESVKPHPHPVQIPYVPDNTNTYPKRPSKLYRFENSDQSNTNYLTSYPDHRENDQENSNVKEEKQSENKNINNPNHSEDSQDEDFVPIKQVVPYTPKVQDIQYVTPKSHTDENSVNQDKSKQQEYAPEHPEKQQHQQQLPSSKPGQNNQYFSSNRFSSFQSTTANPISQRYYAAQKHITGITKQNQQHQQQQQYQDQPTPSTQSWSNKIMPMQYQQYESRYFTASPISTANTFAIKQGSSPTTKNPNQHQSNSVAFRSPIPKYYIPTPKTFQSTNRPTTTTFSIKPNQQKHIPAKQAQIQSTPTPLSSKIIQQSINSDQTNTIHNSQTTFGNRQPKSLLESYIPSWVVVQNQNKQQNRAQQTDINNNYNTISYSVQHHQIDNNNNGNHLKRSTPTTTIIPTKLFKV